MIIESLDIRRFGKLSDLKTELDRGFNLIEGPAESGKSTLAAFICYMLYGFPAERAEELSERAKRAPWDGAEAAGSMTVLVGEERFRIERSSLYTEKGWRDTFALENLTRGVRENGGTAPGERFLGLDAATFRETAFLSDVSRGAPDGATTADAIENILFSGDERLSVIRAAMALKQASVGLSSAESRAGSVAVLEKERDELKDRLAAARARERDRFEEEEELYVTRRKKEEALAELQKFTLLETNYYNAVMIEEYDRLHTLEDASESRVAAIRAHDDAYRANGFLPDGAYIDELATVKAEAASAKRELAEAREEAAMLAAAPDVASDEERALIACIEEAEGEAVLHERERVFRGKSNRFLPGAVLCGAAALALTVLFFVFAFGTESRVAPFLGGLALVALGVGAVCLLEYRRARRALFLVYDCCSAQNRDDFLGNLRRASEASVRLAAAAEQKERSDARIARAEASLALALQAVETALSRFGVAFKEGDDPDAVIDVAKTKAKEYIEHAQKLRAEHDAAEAEVRALRGKLSEENEIAVRARVAPDDRHRYRNQNAEDLRHGVEHFEERLRLLTEAEDALLRDISTRTSGECSAEIAERLMALEARIDALRERAQVISEAMEAVKGGAARLHAEISPRLSLTASRLLYEMTDGKYSDLGIAEDHALSFSDGGEYRTVSFLSDSTEDLAYFSLRLALLDLLCKEAPPICFDGCTSKQDDERALSFFRAVRSLTEEGKQCLFFASGSRERQNAASVFASYRRITMKL